MKTSIIIPIFNGKKYTQKCLESVFATSYKHEFEVIVVDNASIDGSKTYLDGLKYKVMVIRNEENLGFAKACNQGAAAAKGEYLLFLNNDTIVTPGWLDALAEELDADRSVGIVGPKLLYPDGTVQHAGVVFDEKKWPHHIYKKESGSAPYVNKKRHFQCITGACLMIRTKLFKAVRGFDEAYTNGLEDLDLCLRVRESSFGVLYCPESVVYHHESVSEGRSCNDEKNIEIFYSHWIKKIKADAKDYAAEDGMSGMGEFLDVWNGRGLSRKKFFHLWDRFLITAKRDGFSRAVTKTWRRVTMKPLI